MAAKDVFTSRRRAGRPHGVEDQSVLRLLGTEPRSIEERSEVAASSVAADTTSFYDGLRLLPEELLDVVQAAAGLAGRP
jgi:hypothetical protein